MTFVSLLTTPVRRSLSIFDWIVSIAICYACILTIGAFADGGLSTEIFGKALFMMMLGLTGPLICLLDSYYEPMLIPLFIILSVIWGGMLYALMRFALIRPLQILIITVFFMTFCLFGILGIVSTQVV